MLRWCEVIIVHTEYRVITAKKALLFYILTYLYISSLKGSNMKNHIISVCTLNVLLCSQRDTIQVCMTCLGLYQNFVQLNKIINKRLKIHTNHQVHSFLLIRNSETIEKSFIFIV